MVARKSDSLTQPKILLDAFLPKLLTKHLFYCIIFDKNVKKFTISYHFFEVLEIFGRLWYDIFEKMYFWNGDNYERCIYIFTVI